MRVIVPRRRGEGVEHFEKLAPVAVRAGHLFTENLGTACAA